MSGFAHSGSKHGAIVTIPQVYSEELYQRYCYGAANIIGTKTDTAAMPSGVMYANSCHKQDYFIAFPSLQGGVLCQFRYIMQMRHKTVNKIKNMAQQ